MLSLKDIRHRIAAVRNTQKVTRAMKLVAAAKLRGAQRRAMNGRAFASAIHETVDRVSKRLGHKAPALWRRPKSIDCVDVLVITSNRGLCGGFNENLLRAVNEGIEDHKFYNIDVKVFVIGKKGLSYLNRYKHDVEEILINDDKDKIIEQTADHFIERFLSGESSGCNIAFNRFINAARQKVVFWNLIPLYVRGSAMEKNLEYLYEPDKNSALDKLCRMSIINSIEQAILESEASELAARMAAMDMATKNADEMIGHLTMIYNKARQATITNELLDIVNGAEALR